MGGRMLVGRPSLAAPGPGGPRGPPHRILPCFAETTFFIDAIRRIFFVGAMHGALKGLDESSPYTLVPLACDLA